MSINCEINKKVKQLKQKVQKKWLWENFWQNEIRHFEDEFSKTYQVHINQINITRVPYFKDSRKASQFKRDYWAIINFRNWAPRYTQ